VALRASLFFLGAVTLGAQQPYSAEKEAALGASLATEARNSTTAIESPAVRGYVQRIARELAAQLPNPPFSYAFSLIADDRGGPTHEPLAFPGGYILAPASLLQTARNEAEFAGMLAHAMAHVAERHGLRPASSGKISLWVNAGDDDSLFPAAFRSIRRGYETEADVLAVKMTAGAGYDPEDLVRYIARTEPVDSREFRISKIEIVIRALPPKAYSAGSVDEFARMQDLVRR
jgi:predicted Zn-dependent protease